MPSEIATGVTGMRSTVYWCTLLPPSSSGGYLQVDKTLLLENLCHVYHSHNQHSSNYLHTLFKIWFLDKLPPSQAGSTLWIQRASTGAAGVLVRKRTLGWILGGGYYVLWFSI